MDERVERALAALEERSRREGALWESLSPEEQGARRDEFMLCVGRAAGSFLNLLAREARATSILEVGTAYGYSTIWLAEAARASGGRVVGIELSQAKLDAAAAALEEAGLRAHVDLRRGDALEVIAASREELDLVLIDHWKEGYAACFDAVLPRLRRGAIVVADNMTSPPSAGLAALLYRKHVRQRPGVDSVLLPIGAGLLVSRVRGPS